MGLRIRDNYWAQLTIAAVVAFFVGCANSGSQSGDVGPTNGDATTPNPWYTQLSVRPSVISTRPGSKVQLTVGGGTGSYNYQVTSGNGTVNANGLYTAPGNNEIDTVQISDAQQIGGVVNAYITVDSTIPATTGNNSTPSVTGWWNGYFLMGEPGVCDGPTCTYTISWQIPNQIHTIVTYINPTNGQETLFSCASSNGELDASWIPSDGTTVVFRLYQSAGCSATAWQTAIPATHINITVSQ